MRTPSLSRVPLAIAATGLLLAGCLSALVARAEEATGTVEGEEGDTLPDGQAQIDAVDLDKAERIEVIRGPSSVLYGNAAGGVIDITTGDGSELSRSPIIGVQGGSHDFYKPALRQGGESGDWTHSLSLSAVDFDGYREQSAVEKRLLNARLGYRLDEQRTLSALVNILDMPTGEDPGGLTAREIAEDRRQAAGNARRLDAGQSVEQQLVGLHYEDRDALGGEIDVHGFASRRDFEQQLPFSGSWSPSRYAWTTS